jgi:hypothetical protein
LRSVELSIGTSRLALLCLPRTVAITGAWERALDHSKSVRRFEIVATRQEATLEPGADTIERLSPIAGHDDQLFGNTVTVLGIGFDRSLHDFLVQCGVVVASRNSLGTSGH